MPTVRYVIAWYLLLSLITLGTYGWDKWRAARAGRAGPRGQSYARRIPERTLHGMELLGGWPGAMIGQQLFKHKRSKAAYMRVFWVIVALHVAGWTWWLVR